MGEMSEEFVARVVVEQGWVHVPGCDGSEACGCAGVRVEIGRVRLDAGGLVAEGRLPSPHALAAAQMAAEHERAGRELVTGIPRLRDDAVDRLASNLGLTPDERAVAERGWGYGAGRAKAEQFAAGVSARRDELMRQVAAAEEQRLRTLLTERVARAIHDVTAEHTGGVSTFLARGQAEAAVGVFIEFAAGAVAESARVAAVRRLHWPSPDRDEACDCYDGLQDCPTIAALDGGR